MLLLVMLRAHRNYEHLIKRSHVYIISVSLLRPDLPHPPVLLSPAGRRAAFPLQPPESLFSAGYRGIYCNPVSAQCITLRS